VATTTCSPALSALVVIDAWHPSLVVSAGASGTVPSTSPPSPSVNVTDPAGVTSRQMRSPPMPTWAVNVTACPSTEGFADGATTVSDPSTPARAA